MMTQTQTLLARVAIIMGSDSDYPTMQEAECALKQFDISFKTLILSAHRTPYEMTAFAESAKDRGFRVLIAGAGGAAHLPGMLAAYTVLPVIGVPVAMGHLHGQDALLSIVQMPKGIPVATVAIGNAWNAGILAAQILAVSSSESSLLNRIQEYKNQLRQKVLSQQI